MNKLWLLLVGTPPQLIHAQEVKHAPTVEQCRADQKLWLSMAGGSRGRLRFARIFPLLTERSLL